MKKINLALVASLFSVLALSSCSKSTDNVITIGGIAPLSGGVAVYGTECRKGIDLAVEEINAAGGINGMQVKFIVEDDEGDPAKSVNAYKKLTTQNGVRFIIGSLTSGCTQAVTTQAQANHVLQIAPAATAVSITEAGDYIFRACYTDPFQGRVGGKFAAENLSAKTAAILYDIQSDYSVGLTDNFTKEFEKNGGVIISKESYSTNDKDFNAQITKIKATNPDVIYLPDYYNTVSLIARQLRTQGLNVPILGADGWDGLTENAGDEVLNGYYSNHYAIDSDSEAVQKFVASFKNKYNGLPNSFAALGYDSMYMLKDAIIRAGSTDAAAVKEALANTNGDYVTGHLTFDENHNPVKTAVMLKLVKDENDALKAVYEASVNP